MSILPVRSARSEHERGGRARWQAWLVAPVFVLLALVHTWPLATSPARLSLNHNADAQLNAWIVSWVVHQLPRDPRHLFDGNIFHPEPRTLTYSEPLLVPAILGAPVRWARGSPVLTYNLLMLAGLALTGLAGYRVAYLWTGDRLAAVLGGSAVAFNSHLLTRLPHLQALHAYALLLALLATDRILTGRRIRDGLWLGVWLAVLAMTSGYLIVLGTISVATALAVRPAEWTRDLRRVPPIFLLALAVAAALSAPVLVAYGVAGQAITRPLESVRDFSATPLGYLAATARLHASTWSADLVSNPVDAFFPGFVVAGLALAGLWPGVRSEGPLSDRAVTRARIRMLAAIAAVGFVLSLGVATPVYGWLYQIFPPMRSLRAAARFGYLFLTALALLAAFGAAALRRRGAGGTLAAVLLAVLVHAEAFHGPIHYRPFDGIPRIYSLLRGEPDPVVLAEMPFYPGFAAFENGEYVLNSTAHFRPLLNGYSGFTPGSYRRAAESLWWFPSAPAIDALFRLGVTHVAVHADRFGHDAPKVLEAVSHRQDFELMAVSGAVRLYRLRRS